MPCNSYIMIGIIMIVVMTGLVTMSPYVYASRPDPGFMNSSNCKIFSPGSQPANTTCCWKESDGLEFCQTCTWTPGVGYTTCDYKVLQLDSPPNNPPSSSSDPAAPIQDDGVLEQPDKPNKGGVFDLPDSSDRKLDSR